MIRTYTELSRLKTFEERFDYLKLNGQVGSDTFGFDRYLNQEFYKSPEWRHARRIVILRDEGRDLGIEGHEMESNILIHHMNAITMKDIEDRNPDIFNPEYLICCSHRTHNAIHYGDSNLLVKEPIQRTAGDTCLWRR